MSDAMGDSATVVWPSKEAIGSKSQDSKGEVSQGVSKEKSIQVVESELSHPNIFDPDVEDANRDVWHFNSFFTIVILTSGLWMRFMFRLPIMLLRTTGGAFLSAFACILVVLCIPLACLESFTGQYGGKPFLLVMGEVYPFARGVGVAIVIDNLLEMVVYGIHISHLFIYCFYVFKSPMPWESCGEKYNSKICATDQLEQHCMKNGTSTTGFLGNQCVPASTVCSKFGMSAINSSHCAPGTGGKPVALLHIDRPSAQEEYYDGPIRNNENKTWHAIHGLSKSSTRLLAGMAAVWLTAMILSIGGLKTPFIAILIFIVPAIGYLIFLIQTLTLHGAYEGISYLFPFNRKGNNLLSAQCWTDAAALAFSCMSVGYGTYPSLAAKNRTRRRSNFDVLVVGVVCLVLMAITTLSFYSLIGARAKAENVTIEDQLNHNLDMALVLMPTELSRSNAAKVLYFFTIAVFGIGSMSLHLACGLNDISSTCECKYHFIVSFVLIFLAGVGMGTFFTFGGSIFVLEATEDLIFGSKKIILSLLFLIVVIYLYGPRNLIHHIRKRQRIRLMPPAFFWQLCWYVLCPLGLIALPTLALIGKTGAVFQADVALWIKLIVTGYEFYYWIIILGFLQQVAVTIRHPTRPQGVWRLEEYPDDSGDDEEDGSKNSETVVRTETLADIDSHVNVNQRSEPALNNSDGAAKKSDQDANYSEIRYPAGAGESGALMKSPADPDEGELPILPGEKRNAERRDDIMSGIRGLERDPAPDQRDFFVRLHTWSRGPPKPPTPPETPDRPGGPIPTRPDGSIPPEYSIGDPTETVDHAGASSEPYNSQNPPHPPTPPPITPSPPPTPRPPSVDSIGTEYANFMARQSPTMLARALPVPEQERVEAEGASRLPWRDAQVVSEFGPDLLGLMSPTARRGIFPGRGRVAVEPFGPREDDAPSQPAAHADTNTTKSRSKSSAAPPFSPSKSSLVTTSARSESRHSLPEHTSSRSKLSSEPLRSSNRNAVGPLPGDEAANTPPRDTSKNTPSLVNMLRGMK